MFIQMEERKLKYEMKQLAEECYAKAILCDRERDIGGCRYYAYRAIDIYQRIIQIKTIEDATPTRMRIQGVELPDIMHEDVVRERLRL